MLLIPGRDTDYTAKRERAKGSEEGGGGLRRTRRKEETSAAAQRSMTNVRWREDGIYYNCRKDRILEDLALARRPR